MTRTDALALMEQTVKLFPGITRWWTDEKRAVLIGVFLGFKGDYEQGVTIVRAHCADREATTPSIPDLKKRLRAAEPIVPTAYTPQAPAAEPGGYLQMIARLARTQPDHPEVVRVRERCAASPDCAALMRKAGMEIDP